jgi:hypothetical protein
MQEHLPPDPLWPLRPDWMESGVALTSIYHDLHLIVTLLSSWLTSVLMYVHLGFYFFLSGLWCISMQEMRAPIQVFISFLTDAKIFSKNLRLLVIGLYLGFLFILEGIHLGQLCSIVCSIVVD